MRRFHPETLFLLPAAFFGLVFVFLIPPLGGGDEGFHYQRIASIASGELLNRPVEAPAGINRFIHAGAAFFHEGLMPPYHFSQSQWRKMAAITLEVAKPEALQPNYFTVHHPFCYLPQALAFRIGIAAGLTPLMLLYLARLGGLAAALWLNRLAIRRMPSHKFALAALALLPTVVFYRSFLNADTVTTSLAFYFIALVLEAKAWPGRMSRRDIARIALVALVLGACKSSYLVLLLFTLAIPRERFGPSRLRTLALFILPGTGLSAGWVWVMKASYFTGLSYHTWGGNVNPDAQMAFILHHPFDYLAILAHTVFHLSFFAGAFAGIVADIGPGVQLCAIAIIAVLLFFAVALVDGRERAAVRSENHCAALVAFIFAAFLLLTLTLLYTQWTGVAASLIEGFQGRYLLPLLPLLLPFVRPLAVAPLPARIAVALLAGIGLGGSAWAAGATYWG